MIRVIGVRFKRTGKVYYFDPGEHEFKEGDGVVVETARGLEFGELELLPHEVPDEQVVPPLKQVVRVATEQDRKHAEGNRQKETEAAAVAADRIERLGLEMKLVDVEYSFDSTKIIFYFTADGRVDFRELIKELAQHFHMRIELRQIGVRDETKMMGGLGPCGREVCCAGFLSSFHPVSIRMAKEQNISLNPAKISGLCGRLMCCLEFEYQHYRDMRSKLPPKGADVMTPNGPGVVVENNVLEGKSRVRVTLPDKTLDLVSYLFDEIRVISSQEREDALLNPGQFKMPEEDAPGVEAPMTFADGSVSAPQDRPREEQRMGGSSQPPPRPGDGNRHPRMVRGVPGKGGPQPSGIAEPEARETGEGTEPRDGAAFRRRKHRRRKSGKGGPKPPPAQP